MQKIFIDNYSAYKFYQNARANMRLDLLGNDLSKNALQLEISSAQPSRNAKYTASSVDFDSLPYCGNAPLHLSVTNPNHINAGKKLKTHLSKQGFVRNSFVKYKNDIYFASPELVFCQMAKYLTIEQLMLLGIEYCGTFAISQNMPEGFVYNISPITTANKIRNYVKNLKSRCNNFAGIQNATTVSNFLVDNCASPMEARLYLKLCAPRRLGGYGVKNLTANTRIKLSKKAADILGYPYLKTDLCNKSTRIAIEYDSNTFHDNTKQNEKDKLRADALQHDGWKLFTFVPKQMRDVYSFHRMAQKILYKNKQDNRTRFKGFEDRRRKLWLNL